jgi:hypothetical protein
MRSFIKLGSTEIKSTSKIFLAEKNNRLGKYKALTWTMSIITSYIYLTYKNKQNLPKDYHLPAALGNYMNI